MSPDVTVGTLVFVKKEKSIKKCLQKPVICTNKNKLIFICMLKPKLT